MAYFLFVDESGHDRVLSPYEVLAGVAVRDHDIWDLINALHEAEIRNFGKRYSSGVLELKGKKLLKQKVFQHAQLNVSVPPYNITEWALYALENGAKAEIKHLKALALAKLKYVQELFEICLNFHCHVFASIVDVDAEDTNTDGLRKDYGYLFERFFYFLEDQRRREHGIIVFDELEKSQSHILIDQAHRYFKDTATGKQRSKLIIPEPFFVHSELTTGVQIADLAAYVVSWGLRLSKMQKSARPELKSYADQVFSMKYKAVRERNGNKNFTIGSFAYISDLRTKSEKEDFIGE